MDITGPRRVIDMGITRHMRLGDAWNHRRRRRHRVEVLKMTLRRH